MGTRDEELRVRATFDGSELKGGLDGVAAAGTAAGAAVAAGGAKAAEGLKQPLTAAAALEAAIKKTENALSPRGIIDSAARIRIALEDIEKEAKATGKALGPDMAALMRQGEAAYTAAIQRGGRLADTIGDTRKQAGLAAEGYKVLGAAGGGLQSIFGAMDDTGKGAVSTLGKIGIAAFGVVETWKLMKQAGDALDKALSALSDKQNKQANATYQQGVRMAELGAVLRGMPLSFDPVGKSSDQIHESFLRTSLGSGRLRADMKSLAEGLGVTFVNADKLALSASVLGEALDGAFKRGHDQGIALLAANQGLIRTLLDLEAQGVKMPPVLHQYAEELKVVEGRTDLARAATDRLKNAQSELKGAIEAGAKAMIDAAAKASNDVSKAYDSEREAIRKLNHELNEGKITNEEYSEKKKQVVQSTTDTVVSAYEKEGGASKSLSDSIQQIGDKYGLTGNELAKLAIAIEQQVNQFKSSKEAHDGVKAAADALAGAVAAETLAYSSGKTTAEQYGDALHSIAEKAKELEQAKPHIENAVKATGSLKDGTATLDSEGSKNFQAFVETVAKGGEAVKVSLDGINDKIDETVRKLGELQSAAAGAAGLQGGTPPVGPQGGKFPAASGF